MICTVCLQFGLKSEHGELEMHTLAGYPVEFPFTEPLPLTARPNQSEGVFLDRHCYCNCLAPGEEIPLTLLCQAYTTQVKFSALTILVKSNAG